jgi:hypothetical protein
MDVVSLVGASWLPEHDYPTEFDVRYMVAAGSYNVETHTMVEPTWGTFHFSDVFDGVFPPEVSDEACRALNQVTRCLVQLGLLSEGGAWSGELDLDI